MTEEEIQELIQNAFQKTAKELKENPDNVFNYLELQEKYNSVLKDKVKLKRENKQLREIINKINVFLENHDKNAGNLYYKYDNKYLLSEIKEDIRDILKEVE